MTKLSSLYESADSTNYYNDQNLGARSGHPISGYGSKNYETAKTPVKIVRDNYMKYNGVNSDANLILH